VAEPSPGDGPSSATTDTEPDAAQPGKFDRDTAVWRHDSASGERPAVGEQALFAAEVSPDWRAGRGPHGGYLAAMLLRALVQTVAQPQRSPRSLTIHYARAPEPGMVSIATRIEREGRSLSTLSARMEQDGALTALVLAAFSVPWVGPEISDEPMPQVAAPKPVRRPGSLLERGAPPFASNIVYQHRIGGTPFADGEQPMEVGGWLGLAQPRPLDALALAFFADALVPAPFMRTAAPLAAPTVDLTVHFRVALPGWQIAEGCEPSPDELCLARTRTGVIHDGLFEEDGVIWAADGTVLAQSRQLAILLPTPIG
jgi:acyl-CoA thioesterase